MGRHVEAHIQRYIEQGDFARFYTEFERVLREDALATKYALLSFQLLGASLAADIAFYDELSRKREADLTPEELLAALEPTKPVEEHREPLTFDAAWNVFSDTMYTYWTHLVAGIQRYYLVVSVVWLLFLIVYLVAASVLHW